jgi:hypothetical protein
MDGQGVLDHHGRLAMPVSLVVRYPATAVPRLRFPTIRTAARTVLRFIECGVIVPAIVDDHGGLIWEYPAGDPAAEAARLAVARLRALAETGG